MEADAKELHRRATKSISAKRLAEIFRVSEKAIYALSCRSPDVRVIPPIEKVKMIMAELAGLGDVETAAEIAAYITEAVKEIQIARIYSNNHHQLNGGKDATNHQRKDPVPPERGNRGRK
jgi:hypothetical protein